jgi:hypothetical protein
LVLSKLADTRGLWAAVLVGALALAPANSEGRDRGDSLTVLGSGDRRGSQRVPTESEWARELVESLGLADVLPPDAADAERFALLCADRAELVTESGGRRMPGRSALRVVAEPPPESAPGEPLRMVVSVPSPALYLLSVEGFGRQRWVLDGRVIGHLDASGMGVAQAPTLAPLREGPHELAAYLAPEARVERVELSADRSLCIAPADGWHPERPLTHAAVARTLVHALGLERYLPAIGEGVSVPGADFSLSSGGGERSTRRLRNGFTGAGWARAGERPAGFAFRVRLAEPGLYSLLVRAPGGGQQVWSIDGRYRSALEPRGTAGRFEWNHVLTLPLASGEHVVRVTASPGSGVDRLRLVPHRRRASDYVSVLAGFGFDDGPPDTVVTRRIVRRSLARAAATRGDDFLLHRIARDPGRSPLVEEASAREAEPGPAAPAPAYRPETWR